MFLSTLGLKTDRRLREFVLSKEGNGSIMPKGDLRGKKHVPQNMSDVDAIQAHINSYHPVVSHYNIKNAPEEYMGRL